MHQTPAITTKRRFPQPTLLHLVLHTLRRLIGKTLLHQRCPLFQGLQLCADSFFWFEVVRKDRGIIVRGIEAISGFPAKQPARVAPPSLNEVIVLPRESFFANQQSVRVTEI